MTDRRELEAALRASGEATAPPVDAEFVAALERRLMTLDDHATVVPFARRARRLSAATTIAITLTFVGAAAAAGIVATSGDQPRRAPRTSPTTVAVPPTQSTATTPSASPVPATPPAGGASTIVTAPSAPSTAGPATTGPVTASATPTTDPPTTSPGTISPGTPGPVVTAEATTLPAVTAPAPSTTEVRVPATLAMTCTTDGTTVTCAWSAGPTGTVRYAVLRAQPGSGLPGRAFFVDAPATGWTDPMAVPGTTYSYLVHAMDATQTSLGHSDAVAVTCC